MTDRVATIEYIGNMADQLAGMAREAGLPHLVSLLNSAAFVADREWLAAAKERAALEAHPDTGE
ncbi:hypothetical protein [Brevundimonas sp.]|uniref:hypothetical protein n=1 Tax=Brevundimonas sp. TaxID=1871086 RepID=UPI0025D6A80E|nr:hypothetical protein [Brevundimonas sp.]